MPSTKAENGFDVDAVFHRLNDPVMDLNVFGWLGLHYGDSRTHDPGVADRSAGFYTEGFGLVGCVASADRVMPSLVLETISARVHDVAARSANAGSRSRWIIRPFLIDVSRVAGRTTSVKSKGWQGAPTTMGLRASVREALVIFQAVAERSDYQDC